MFKSITTLFVFIVSALFCCSCNKPSNLSTAILKEGEHHQPLEALHSSEPVQTYLQIRKLLSDNKIAEAASLTTDPDDFGQSMSAFRNRVGQKAFSEGNLSSMTRGNVHSVHIDGNQHLLVIEAEGSKFGSFYLQQANGSFLEIQYPGSVSISAKLSEKLRAIQKN